VTRFVVQRLLFGVLMLWLISVVVFALFFIAPHDPARTIAGRLATPDTVAAVRHRLGLDQPVLAQYGHFLDRLLHGDLGYSYYNSASVWSLIVGRLPVTVSLVAGGAVLWLAIGIGTGVLAARHPRSAVDRGVTLFVLTGLSMPTFLLGLLLLYFLFFRLPPCRHRSGPRRRLRAADPEPGAVGPAPGAAVGDARARHRRDLLG
jgi:peptide/nickel transport system permease protein